MTTDEDSWKLEAQILAHEARHLRSTLKTEDVAVIQEELRRIAEEKGEHPMTIAAAIELVSAPDFFTRPADLPNGAKIELTSEELQTPLDIDDLLKS